MPLQSSTGMYQESKYIVDNTSGSYAYTTIQSALNAAQAAGIPALVLVRPGVYTENLTLYDGIDIRGAGGFSTTSSLEIIGTHTPPLTGTVSFQNISLTSTTDIFSSVAAGSSNIILKDLVITVTNGYTFNLLNWTGGFFANSVAQSSANNGEIRNTGRAQVFYTNSEFGFGTGNHATISNSCTLFNVVSRCPITFQTSGNVFINGGSWILETLTFSGTVAANIANSYMNTNPDPAITTTSTGVITLSNVTIDTLAANVITGTGTIQLASVTYVESDTIAGTVIKDFTTEFETGILKLADATSGILTASSGVVSSSGALTDGQLLIGSTGGAPVRTTLTAGTNITITNGPGSSTISSTGGSSSTDTFQAINVQTFISSGNYTPSPTMKYCLVEVLGGGGAGGGAEVTNGSQTSIGSGAGAGEYRKGVFSAATIGASQTVTIGAAGTGNSGAAGGNGGNTSFGALISANGGTGGTTLAASGGGSILGGLGGTGGSGGSVSTPGASGGSQLISTSFGSPAPPGANSQYGAGGLGSLASSAANNALGYGAGGSGVANYTSQAARAGGNGSAGVVIVTEFLNEPVISTQAVFGGIISTNGGNLQYLKYNGSTWGCGSNQYGDLGNLTTTSYSSPIAAVGAHSFIQLTSFGFGFLGLKSNGSAWAWGDGSDGALGNLTTTNVSSPVSVVGAHSFTQIAGGNAENGYGLKSDGSVWAWGLGTSGALGNLTTTGTSSPVSVVGAHSFTQIAGKNQGCVGLKADGSVWTWGNNAFGQLGNLTTTNTSSPVNVVGAHSFTQIAGGFSCYGLKSDGSVWAWGVNNAGDLGNNTTTNTSSPVSVVGAHSFVEICSIVDSVNGACLGRKADGSVWAWGLGSPGTLGNLSASNSSSPVSVVGGIHFSKLVQNSNSITAGAFDRYGRLWAWGNNTFGQLGNNTTTNTSSPVLVLNTP